VADAGGNVREARDYYPFGLQMPGRVYVQGSETREGFTGHELDQETGMYYAGARYYMPALGRWTSVDPLADKFPSWSPYNYVMNNPVGLTDPTGMAPCDPPSTCTSPIGVLRQTFGWLERPVENLANRLGMDRKPEGSSTPLSSPVSTDDASMIAGAAGGAVGVQQGLLDAAAKTSSNNGGRALTVLRGATKGAGQGLTLTGFIMSALPVLSTVGQGETPSNQQMAGLGVDFVTSLASLNPYGAVASILFYVSGGRDALVDLVPNNEEESEAQAQSRQLEEEESDEQ